jgi:hypothetical protein
MAKTAKKTAGRAAGKKAPASGKRNKKEKPARQLTWLAKGLLAITLMWFVTGGYFATNDLMSRRAACIDWLVGESRAEQGYKRVFNTAPLKFGCSLQKLGLRGFIAEPPIYPNVQGLLLVFAPPVIMMGFILLMFKFRRGWILHQKKKVWAKAGPLDLDDFEDTRDRPSEEEIAEMDAAEAEEKLNAAESMDAALEGVVTESPAKASKKPAPSASKGKEGASAKRIPAAKPAEPEKPSDELSELEKILRQVDD